MSHWRKYLMTLNVGTRPEFSEQRLPESAFAIYEAGRFQASYRGV